MRRRLLLVTLATTSLVVVAFAVPLAALVRDVARDRAVTDAERDIAALAPVLALADDPDLLAATVQGTTSGADGRLTVFLPDGTQVGDPTPADEAALSRARDEQSSFSEQAGDELVLYSSVVTGDAAVSVVRARLPDTLLTDGVGTAWLALAAVGLVLVGAAALLSDRLARSLTTEASGLATTARAVAGGDPSARVSVGTTPELGDAARALNLLADRIDELRAAERERVADLSHRLRTPLTALRLDAESSGNPSLAAQVDRLEAAVSDLVRTARRPLHGSPVGAVCDLAEVVQDRTDFWGALADDDGRRWVFRGPGAIGSDTTSEMAAPVSLTHDEAAAVVDALIGNVFAHTPDGTAYEVSLTLAHGTARLRVDDDGPGIDNPEGAVARGATTTGTGLGLDIARASAEAAGGRLELGRSPTGGASVELTLPLRRA